MFSNRVWLSTIHSFVFSHLQSTGNITSDPIIVNGVSWCCLFQWKNDHLYFKLGLRQPSVSDRDRLISCVVQASVVIHNRSYRLRYSLGHLLTCTDEWHPLWQITFSHAQIQVLLDDGKLNITVDWQMYKPTIIRSLSLTGTFSFPAPRNCMEIAGEMDGFMYVLVKSNMQECSICSLSIYNPDRVFTLARLPVHSPRVWLSPETNRVAVTEWQSTSTLRLDVLWLDDCHLESRVYTIPTPDRDLRLYAERPTRNCWISGGRGIRWDGDDVAQPKRVHFKFWSLDDDGQFRLLTHLAQPTSSTLPQEATVTNDHFYCFVSSPKGHLFVFVSSWEQPHIWQPYELAPQPNFQPSSVLCNWGSLFLSATIINAQGPLEENKTERRVLFEMRFEGADCLLEPALALPNGMPGNWLMQRGVLLCLEPQRNLFSMVNLQPPKLKIDALLSVQRQLGVRDGQDRFGKPVWKEWRDKLTQLLEQAKISLI